MELIIIACCKNKRAGGTTVYTPSGLLPHLSGGSHQQLLQARQQIARLKGMQDGADFGNASAADSPPYLPAWQRYIDKMYQRASFETLYPSAQGVKVVIVSALYGFLDASDSIRLYDLAMQFPLDEQRRVLAFWQSVALGKLLEEYILALNPACVHDLLPLNYRQALRALSVAQLVQAGIRYKPFKPACGGMGALLARGDHLRQLLQRQ